MDASDVHLENALGEYNDRVNELEPLGDSPELMEAYVNRGCVLHMMEYRTSAMEDLESASEIIDALEAQGYDVDAGTYVRVHATMASILFDEDGDCSEEYALAAKRLDDLHPDSRHYDRRSIVRTCEDACKNLIDSGYPEDVGPYIEKALSLVTGHGDAWSENRTMEVLALRAEALKDLGDTSEAIEAYARSIDTGMELLDRGALEDPEELVMSFVMKADCEADMDLTDLFIRDTEAAITILEHMMEFHRLPDPEVLIRLHHDAAGALMKQGRIEDAEKHLVKAMGIGVHGASDYIDLHRPRDGPPQS